MRKSFQAVFALWITPDFSEVNAGRLPPPRVNHSTVDFEKLARAFEEFFPYGPAVQIQVPNDTIDQVSVHVRASGKHTSTMRCEDFGKALLAVAKSNKGQVLDVSQAWNGLHALPNRDFAPPPVILPLVVTAEDFEDAMIWHANTRPILGLKAFDPLEELTHPGSTQDNGFWPAHIRERLADIFGTKYEAPGVIDRMASDPLPKGYSL